MKLAIFDFDGTLFPKDTLPFLLAQWKKLKYSRIKYYKTIIPVGFLYIKYKTGMKSKLSREQMKLFAMEKFNLIFSDMSEQEIDQYFIYCCEAVKGLLNKAVIAELVKAQAEGFHTVLLSGSYENLLNHIGGYLSFDTVIGTKMHFNSGIFDSNKKLEIISGELKFDKINECFKDKPIDWQASRAYADSYSDLPILKAVGQPTVVSPDALLQSVTLEMNWKMIAT